jgi:phosphatidylinositol alpha-1,6-mannosyltransferase
VRHILLTNDFPPKVGGIQSYLWELWRRLPPEDVTVVTPSYRDSEWWDSEQAFRVVRTREPVLVPNPHLLRKVRRLAGKARAEAVVIDPALPLGLLGPRLGLPYALVLHGAEVTVPGRLPVSRKLLAKALSGASLWVSAGSYPESEAVRAIRVSKPHRGGSRPNRGDSRPPNRSDETQNNGEEADVAQGNDGAVDETVPRSVRIPPGVDTRRFRPLPRIDRSAARAHFGLPASGPLIVSVSRLVPRKGMDTLLEAASSTSASVPGLSVAIAGSGRDRGRLERLAGAARVPVKFVGTVPDAELPSFYACGDVFALCPHSRWGGLEQEGFGMVLVEAAACGVPCVTLDSGGAAEAVADQETGFVVSSPHLRFQMAPRRRREAEARALVPALARLFREPGLALRMGEAGRRRAEDEFSYDVLAPRLAEALSRLGAREA